jgi:prenyltransferase beta subunit
MNKKVEEKGKICMAHISDEAIKEDIYSTLKMWDLFNSLDKEKQDNLVDYIFQSYGYLYREENVKIGKMQQ